MMKSQKPTMTVDPEDAYITVIRPKYLTASNHDFGRREPTDPPILVCSTIFIFKGIALYLELLTKWLIRKEQRFIGSAQALT